MDSVRSLNLIQCVGCGLCAHVCPVHAITMKYKNGFLYPFVDEADCISCGKCVKTCQINNCLEKSGLKNAYLAVAKDNAIYEKGSSGGVFGVFAHYFIEVLKGAVCGVMMDEDCNVKHCVIDKVEEIPKLQGSKYVQSDLTGIFEQMESLLKRGVQVLFCGTPCQVASMKTVFSNYPNLFLIDLVCHGVPSPQLLKNHIAQNIAPGETVKEVRFRTKDQYDRYGFNLLVKTNEKERLLAGSVDPYYRLFLASASFRESCYSCQYAQRSRVSDITIGDCGNSNYYTGFYPDRTVSTVYPISDEGKKLWEMLKKEFYTKEVDVEFEANANHQLNHPSERPTIRNRIENCTAAQLPDVAEKELGKISFKHRMKVKLKRVIPEKYRIGLKRIIKT